MPILIVTANTLDDSCIDSVTREIKNYNEETIALATDRFPTGLQLTMSWDHEDSYFLNSSREFDLSQISAVWIRHMDVAASLPDDFDETYRHASRELSTATIWTMLECLQVFQLDPPHVLQKVPQKLRQLQLARSLGLEIPRTLLTNDPAKVRDFAKTCDTGMITKLVDSSILQETEQGMEPIYTKTVTSEDMEQLDSLQFAPMIFQEKIAKALELRITVVGHRLFVAAVDSTKSVIGADDWRQDSALAREFFPYDKLPNEISSRILRLLDEVGLNFATVDIILTPDNRLVFLEFNTVSDFAFVEKSTGFPISASIAELLLGRVAPRV